MRLGFNFFPPSSTLGWKKKQKCFEGRRPGLVLRLLLGSKVELHLPGPGGAVASRRSGTLRGTSHETDLTKPVSKGLS